MLEDINLILLITLYTLGVILLTLLIVLTFKTIIAVTKFEKTLDDVHKKLNSLNQVFNAIDFATDKIALVSESLISKMASIILSIFNKKNKKEENENE